jgi:hypothetical protein
MIVATCEQGEAMEGTQFVTNDKGEKVDVLIDLARHGEMWEDIYDQLLAEERANDKLRPTRP